MIVFRQGRRYRGSGADRVYRNLPIAFILSLFALLVFWPLLRDAFSRSTSPGLRIFGVVVVVVLASYVIRAARVQVRVTPNDVRVRNIFTTRRAPWTAIVAVRPVPAYAAQFSLFGGLAYNVAFELADGRELRALALRRSQADASAIADDLARLARGFGAPAEAFDPTTRTSTAVAPFPHEH